jgi:protein SCO1/2
LSSSVRAAVRPWGPALLALSLWLEGCRTRAELPTYGAVPPFALTDQAGKPFSRETLAGKVWAAAFVFTRCPSACPRVTRAMHELQVRAATRKVPLHLVSFSIDPEFDTPEVLRRYATDYKADLSTWSFVTGDAAAIQRTAERGLKIAVEGKADPSKPDFGITHGTQLVLVDGAGEIRGYYATNEEAALGRLLEDAKSLR